MKKLKGLALLAAAILPACAQKAPRFDPLQGGPIVRTKTIYDIKITPLGLGTFRLLKLPLLMGGMEEEEYEELLEVGEDNVGRVAKATLTQTSYPDNPSLDQTMIEQRVGDLLIRYFDFRKDGYIVDGDDKFIDLVEFFPQDEEPYERRGENSPEYNQRVVEMIGRYKNEIKSFLD